MPRYAAGSLSQMDPQSLALLGTTLATTTAAIEATVRPQRVYCALFSEATRAIHFHLFPRTEWLAARYLEAHPRETQISGPRLMDWARRTFQEPIAGQNRDAKLEKIRTWLRSANLR
jgi:diadenosine tetraphosphate (Ap4A) HIT family hydrolase